ncbi:hypothetical protein KFK09_006429 [Dendrobium nobile]|uniref:Uncharacterized protein n=1 Tax=Dendrobium nobile TaxID=94219 RepID=A0A8T3BRB1_DENNO|nr:hypothetical protein KFK09_006429 [Dendrobium nobile]
MSLQLRCFLGLPMPLSLQGSPEILPSLSSPYVLTTEVFPWSSKSPLFARKFGDFPFSLFSSRDLLRSSYVNCLEMEVEETVVRSEVEKTVEVQKPSIW